MFDSDPTVVAPLVAEYYQWLSGHGGTDPEVLLSKSLTPSQRRLLLLRMDDINVCWGITAPLRVAAEGSKPAQHARGQRG